MWEDLRVDGEIDLYFELRNALKGTQFLCRKKNELGKVLVYWWETVRF